MKLLSPTDFRSSIKWVSSAGIQVQLQSLAAHHRRYCLSKSKAAKAIKTGFRVLLWLMEEGHCLFSAQFILLAQMQTCNTWHWSTTEEQFIFFSSLYYCLKALAFDISPAPVKAATHAGGGSARELVFTSLHIPHFHSCTFVHYKVFYETDMSWAWTQPFKSMRNSYATPHSWTFY